MFMSDLSRNAKQESVGCAEDCEANKSRTKDATGPYRSNMPEFSSWRTEWLFGRETALPETDVAVTAAFAKYGYREAKC